MSKTFKTRPLGVRMLDYKDQGVGVEAYHNHDNRECDLPRKDYHENSNHLGAHSGSPQDICHWSFAYTGKGLCGCKMCTEQVERKAENRKERHRVKQELQKVVGVISVLEEIEV